MIGCAFYKTEKVRRKTLYRYISFNNQSVDVSKYQRTSGPVNTHLLSWPSKAQNIQNLENIW